MRVASLALAASLSFSTMTAFADWKQEGNTWKYQNSDGKYATSTWQWINGKSYCFDSNGNMYANTTTPDGYTVNADGAWTVNGVVQIKNETSKKTSVYKGYKQDKIEMRGDRAEMSDFPLYLNTVAGGLDCRDQTIGGFSFVVKIYALPVVEIIG